MLLPIPCLCSYQVQAAAIRRTLFEVWMKILLLHADRSKLKQYHESKGLMGREELSVRVALLTPPLPQTTELKIKHFVHGDHK